MPKTKVNRVSRARKIAPRAVSASRQAIVARPTVAESIEKVLIGGDLSPLSPEERVQYYNAVCKSLGLNPLTGPFLYILFRETDGAPAKLQLYATKDCAAQLRKLHRVSVLALRREVSAGMSTVEADVQDGLGKKDSAIGVVPLWKWKDGKHVDLTGREYANAIMKTETKAKRRATLSICGLAFLDESELDTMQIIGGVTRDGRIYEFKQPQLPEASESSSQETDEEFFERWEAPRIANESTENREWIMKRLAPAQRQIIERKMAEAKSSPAPRPAEAASGGEKTAQVSGAAQVSQEEGPAKAGAGQASNAKPGAPALFWIYHEASKTYTVDGPAELKKSLYAEVLKRFWDGGVKALVVRDDESFEQLKYELDRRKVPFHRLREPGE